MTTIAQVKSAVAPLLARHSDLALVNRFLIVKPVGHLTRGVLIDRRSAKEVFHVRQAIIHLFEPQSSFNLNFGADLYKKT
ncbi:MAG: hypothetical protein ABWZ80_02530 [Beijerinckiaceae bacterium]